MPYCVHCGVKLNPSEEKCPLCDTPVYDPNGGPPSPDAYQPDRIDMFPRKRINWPFASGLALSAIAAVAFSVILCDLLTTGRIGWSCYVVAGCIFTVGFAAIPMMRSRIAGVLIPFAGIAAAMALIAHAVHGMRWFLYLALPATGIAAGYTAVAVWLACKKKLRLFYRIAVCLFLLIVSMVIIETVIDLYTENAVHIFWSLYAVIPLSLIALFFAIAAHNRRIVEYIKKNMFLSPD